MGNRGGEGSGEGRRSDGEGGNRRPSFGGPRRAPPGGAKAPRDNPRLAQDQKAKELSQRTGIPFERARRVVGGHEKLNDVIDEMARRDRVDGLMARHGLNRALATQVELGQASLEAILARRHIDEAFVHTRDRSLLDDAVASGREYTLGLHGHKAVRAKVTLNDKYEFEYLDMDTNETVRAHKLQLKYAFVAEDYKKIRKGLDFDDARRKREIQPVPRPQDRYACSDKRLGLLWHHKQPVAATTLEGERFTGEIAWVSRYEFALRVKQEKEVVVFRHALDLLDELAKHEKK